MNLFLSKMPSFQGIRKHGSAKEKPFRPYDRAIQGADRLTQSKAVRSNVRKTSRAGSWSHTGGFCSLSVLPARFNCRLFLLRSRRMHGPLPPANRYSFTPSSERISTPATTETAETTATITAMTTITANTDIATITGIFIKSSRFSIRRACRHAQKESPVPQTAATFLS